MTLESVLDLSRRLGTRAVLDRRDVNRYSLITIDRFPQFLRAVNQGARYMHTNPSSSHHGKLCWAFAVVFLLFLTCGVALGAVDQKSPTPGDRHHDGAGRASVTVADGQLSVNLREADLHTILSQIAREAGFSLIMPSRARETISAQFSEMELSQGLRRLLRLASLNYAMIYEASPDDRESLKEVWVITEGGGDRPSHHVATAHHDEGAAPDARQSLEEPSTPEHPFLALQRGQQPVAPAHPQANSFMDAIASRQPPQEGR